MLDQEQQLARSAPLIPSSSARLSPLRRGYRVSYSHWKIILISTALLQSQRELRSECYE